MRLQAGRFFLACYTLFGIRHVLAEPQCAIDPSSTVSDACISYSDLDVLNRNIAAPLKDLTHSDFFAYYRLNLYNKICPFWNDESSICGNRACAVDTIDDEDDIPAIWRSEELSKLEGLRAQHPGPRLQKERPKKRPLQYQLGENVDESCVLEEDDECDERDYCVPEDEGATSKGDYVSLLNNPEKFTGYSGPGAQQVWDAIYKENCFAKSQDTTSSNAGALQAAANIRNVFQEYGRHAVDGMDDPYAFDDQCIEQRAFHRIISGMHASISTHICWDYFNQTTGEWHRNLDCYKERLHQHPERVSNLYFNYALVTRAIAKLHRDVQSYTFCSGDLDQDYETKQKVLKLTTDLSNQPLTFDESIMFRDPDMIDLKDDFKMRFRNVSRIMDCVGCDKCRLWGKVQTAGYGAALKVLFEFSDDVANGENPHLRRTELVALVNTFGRLSHSMEAIRLFRQAVNTGDLSFLGTNDSPAIEDADPIRNTQSSPQASTPSSSASTEAEEYLDMGDYNVYMRNFHRGQPDDSIWEMTKAEFYLVWKTYMFVLQQWWNLPGKIGSILVMEMGRLWNWWLGLPVMGASWDWRLPNRQEL